MSILPKKTIGQMSRLKGLVQQKGLITRNTHVK